MNETGRCLCGAVTYEAEGIGDEAHVCHCAMCRRWSGGPAFAIPASSVRFTGEDHIARHQSSDWAERGFCNRCGTNLFYRFIEADQYFLWMGTFDDQSNFKLAREIYVDNKPDCYELSGNHPRLTEAEFLATLQLPQD
jgi:hypothetical protein